MVRLGGIQKTTLIDYPGRLAATVFLTGCNFRCPFCYSGELVLPEKIEEQGEVDQKEFFSFLKERAGELEGIVICGGEPTINDDLPLFLKKIKGFGFLVKLDTNGSNPDMLEKLIGEKLVDYVAMDIKGPAERYRDIVKADIDIERIKKSIEVLKKGEVDYEFRMTVVPGIHGKEDILKAVELVSPAKKLYLQAFVAEKTLDPDLAGVKPYPKEDLEGVVKEIALGFEICALRGY